jgi:hypothetical protein
MLVLLAYWANIRTLCYRMTAKYAACFGVLAAPFSTLTCVTLADCRWDSDKWPIFAQV